MKKVAAIFLLLVSINSISQNVGIGTTTPETKLHVTDSVSGVAQAIKLQGNDPFIGFYSLNNTYKGYLWENGNGMQLGTSNSSPVTIAPWFNTTATFLANGSVGIGTVTPATRLHVQGAASEREMLRLNSGNYPFMSFQQSGAPKATIGLEAANAPVIPEHFRIATDDLSNLPVHFYTGGLTRLMIGGTGTVTVGGPGSASPLVVLGYTSLGDVITEGAPRIKMKKITQAISNTNGGFMQLFHGLNSTKIISVTVLVEGVVPSELIPPGFTEVFGRQYEYEVTANHIEITNTLNNCSVILGHTAKILITYEE